jgi:hypothetical protein
MTMITSTKLFLIMTINILISIALIATPLTAVEAQTTAEPTTALISNSNTTNTTSSAIDLSQQPVLQERTRVESETQINYAYASITFIGNGTLTIPNSNINNSNTRVNFTSNGSALISFMTQSSQGTEIIRTDDGTTATLTFYEIAKFNPVTGEGEGIIIAEVSTNPSGPLAQLNGMILAGIDDIRPNGESNVTLWEWESRISNFAILPI